jgi:hypothetical protein
MDAKETPDSAVAPPRPTTWGEIPGALAHQTRLQFGPILEFVGEFGWGVVLLLMPTMLLAGQSLMLLLSVTLGLPAPEARYDGSLSPAAFIWKHHAEIYLGIPPLAAMAGFSLRRWIRALRLARRLEDIPTSTVRAAAQGEIELRGKAVRLLPETMRSKLSHTPCLWYHYRVTHKSRNKKGETSDRVVAEGQSAPPLLIDDGSGLAVLRLAQAHLTSLEEMRSHPSAGVTHSERLVREGDDVFAWGTLESWDPAARPRDLEASDLLAIETVRRARYPDQDASASLAVLRPMRDGTPIGIALSGQNPLVAHHRFNAKVCVFFAVLSLGTMALLQRVGWLATH